MKNGEEVKLKWIRGGRNFENEERLKLLFKYVKMCGLKIIWKDIMK
jgi:hypothetical protein